MAKLTISSCAFVHPKDVNVGRVDANKLASALDVCVGRATLALRGPVGTYSDLQRDNMAIKFRCMQETFRHVRAILGGGYEKPSSVDALAVARLAVEDLYALCLMFEAPRYVSDYLQDGWRKAYVQLLLEGRETKNLERFDEYCSTAPARLDGLRRMLGISDAQVAGVHRDELGVAMPKGLIYQYVPRFPTPGGVIGLLPAGDKRAMLERLYFEYQYLCSFAHGLPEEMLFKTMFNSRSPVPHQFSPGQRRDVWQRAVAERSFNAAFLSVVQAAAELTALYPIDAALAGAAMEAWGAVADGLLLGQVIWNIRTKKLLKVIDLNP